MHCKEEVRADAPEEEWGAEVVRGAREVGREANFRPSFLKTDLTLTPSLAWPGTSLQV